MFVGAFVIAAAVGAPAAPEDWRNVRSAVTAFVEALDAGSRARIAASCTGDATVVDEDPPYLFAGRGCGVWWDAVMQGMREGGLRDVHAVAREARITSIDRGRAYVVVPVRVTSVVHGESRWRTLDATIVLHRRASVWRIVSLTWSVTGLQPQQSL